MASALSCSWIREIAGAEPLQHQPRPSTQSDPANSDIVKTLAKWNRSLLEQSADKEGVPSAPVYKIADVVSDPQIKHRGLFKAKRSDIPQLVSPIRFIKEHKRLSNPAPRLGQNTRDVLQELGYSRASIKKLTENKAI